MSIERGGPSNHLNHLRTRRACQLSRSLSGRNVCGAAKLHFYQLARAQGIVQRLDEGGRQPVLAHVDSCTEAVGLRTQRRPFLSGESSVQRVTPGEEKNGNGLNGSPSLKRRASSNRMT